QRTGQNSWRIKFDLDRVNGDRQTRYVTVRGKRQDAERELTRLLGLAHDGNLVEPSKIAVANYLRSWLDGAHGLAGKTAERYRQLAEQQIIPHLGSVALQKLRRAHIALARHVTEVRRQGWCADVGANRPPRSSRFARCAGTRSQKRTAAAQCRQHHRTAQSRRTRD